MAPGWYGFRHHSIFARELNELSGRWRQGRLLNVGCGHGADFIPFKSNFRLTGLDFSEGMLSFARKYARKYGLSPDLVLADAVSLPFSENSFDCAIAIATYHHLETATARITAYKELNRVLKPGGEAFVTVWNRLQPRFWGYGRDSLIPWKSGEETLSRYYHLYTYSELRQEIEQAGMSILSIRPESSYKFPLKMFSRNICLLVRK